MLKKILGFAGKKVYETFKPKINVGNLKKNQETMGKLIKTTDSYVKAAKEKGFEKLSKDLRRAGSKSLQKTDNILRKKQKDGGRMGLKKGGGSDLGMQSVKYGLDNNPKVTAADPKAKFIAANKKKKKKFESPMAKSIKKKNKKRFV
jgi:hypothetical protein